MEKVTSEHVMEHLRTILDPEIGIDIVGLGLIYDVTVSSVQTEQGSTDRVHILMTLTTPGCPLATTIEDMIHRQLDTIDGLDGYRDVTIEITFDPPWVQDMMSDEAKAELGF
jgi:metal-sulfur cluster biosynthetic enzyme